MAKLSPAGQDIARLIVSGTFTATGQSGNATNGSSSSSSSPGNASAPMFSGNFNAGLWGTFAGTISLERSFDGGTTYSIVSIDSAGTAATFTAPVQVTASEPEQGVLYRWNCSAYTSGTVNYRISQ